MLLNFSISNFRSIKDKVTIDLVANKRIKEHADNLIVIDKHTKLQSTTLLFGNPSTGKSSAIGALSALVQMLLYSSNEQGVTDIYEYLPFIFDEKSKQEPTEIEMVFIAKDSIKYRYKIAFNALEIITEDLYFSPKWIESKLFNRNKMMFTFGDYYRGRKKRIESCLLKHQLFLAKAFDSNVYVNAAYLYFSDYFYTSSNTDLANNSNLLQAFSYFIAQEDTIRFKENILRLLRLVDNSIVDFQIVNNSPKNKLLLNLINEEIENNKVIENQFHIKFYHHFYVDGKEAGIHELHWNHASQSVQRMLTYGGVILSVLLVGGTLIVDDFDKQFSTEIAKVCIQLFQSSKNNPTNAQLIFTSSNSQILDNEIFRRDQIYFVSKNNRSETQINRLSDLLKISKSEQFYQQYIREYSIINQQHIELKFGLVK